MGKVIKWTVAVALCVACGKGGSEVVTVPPADGGNPNVGVDAGPVADAGPADPGQPDAGSAPDAGQPDAGQPDAGQPDAGQPDAGHPDAGQPDAGQPDAGGSDAGTPPDAGTDGGVSFGGPGPWPLSNQIYGAADGILESPIVGTTTDEAQNLWIATHDALYLLKPGQNRFRRFDAKDGLHLPGNPVPSCEDSAGVLKPCPFGSADSPGISEIVGGGRNEVFVGYFGHHDWNDPNDGTEQDPFRHSGKLDRVRLEVDGSLEVIRFDMVSNNTVQFWHNRTVERMIYDHFIHPHELFVGTDHGVDKFSPDKWKPTDPAPNNWFLGLNNNQVWMSDHLHPQACYHHPCVDESDLRLGDWRGLGFASNGDLWVAGRWAAGEIIYTADNSVWYDRGGKSFSQAFGDPYSGNCSGGSRPVFCVPQEGDFVNLSAVTVTRDPKTGQDKVWFSSGVVYNDKGDVNYGVAAFLNRPGPGDQVWTYFDPIRDIGMAEVNVRDMLALPDGRLVLAGPSTGLTIWDPVTGKHVSIRAGQGIPSDNVLRLELDRMVEPPALHVSTEGGAAVLRKLP